MTEPSFQEKINRDAYFLVRTNRETDELQILVDYLAVLDCYAEDQKEREQKLQQFYENMKDNIEVDEKSGYHVNKERKELLKIVERLLKE